LLGDDPGPAVPGSHVDQRGLEVVVERAFPQQAIVGEHHRSRYAEVLELLDPTGRIPELARKSFVVRHFGR
jgi:hypothetical protein